ncbi:hypothetical protein E8E12_003795 [Didymella heteroderae]|uniref:Uncharacterized protein n=1 Tax=Didymella heteroderae TaxID=1769908 RepID=A0A9P4WRA2_9PLEO|nr:hypothetical protein E8E12_003795 [Didymella heteroderae]
MEYNYTQHLVMLSQYTLSGTTIMRLYAPVAVAGLNALPLTIGSPGSPHGQYNLDPSHYGSDCIVDVDVAVIGGGSVGTYAAVQLKDQGEKVLVIEKKGRLGGHTETYTDPQSGYPIDMGVRLYYDDRTVHDWYARFNLSTITINVGVTGGAAPQYVDFRTGKVLQGVPAGNDTALAAALQRYSAVLAKYPQLESGYFLPDPVPEDLLMPFGQFVEKYDIGAAVQFFFNVAGAFGDTLELPTLQQFRAQSLGLLATASNFQASLVMNNSLLFGKATAELLASKSLFLSSKVLHTERLQGFGYYASVIRNAGPVNVTLQNLAVDQPYALPPMPGFYNCNPTGVNPSLSLCFYGTKLGQILSDDEAKAAIVASLKQYQTVNGLKTTDPDFVAFSNHSPYWLMAGSEATKAGFYEKMYALQGKRNTFWTGATWRAQDSSASWKFTKNIVLPALVASL